MGYRIRPRGLLKHLRIESDLAEIDPKLVEDGAVEARGVEKVAEHDRPRDEAILLA